MWRQRGLLAALGVSGVLEALGVGVQGVLGVPEGEGGLACLQQQLQQHLQQQQQPPSLQLQH